MNDLTVIIPVFNEESTLENIVERLYEELKTNAISFEIILVDDGSTDHSVLISDNLKRRFEDLILKRHQKNLGYGQSILTGIHYAQKNWTVIVPSDGQLPVDQVVTLWKARKKSHVICGQRVDRQDSLFRLSISSLYNILVRRSFDLPKIDIGWVKMYETAFLKEVKIKTRGFIIDTEIMAYAIAHGKGIVNVPLKHRARAFGQSKITISKFGNIFEDFFKIRKSFKQIKESRA